MVEDTLRAAGAEVACAFTVWGCAAGPRERRCHGAWRRRARPVPRRRGRSAVAEAPRHLGAPFLIARGYGEVQEATAGPAAAGAPLLCNPFEPEALVAAVAALILPARPATPARRDI